MRDAALRYAQRFGVSPELFAQREAELLQRSGGAAGPGDVFWEIAEGALERYLRTRDWDGAGVVYFTQARWLYEHEPDKPYADFQRLAHEAAVLDFRGRRHHRRVAIEARRCCEPCRVLQGEEFSFARALEERPLPNPACTLDWCACTWRGIPVRGR